MELPLTGGCQCGAVRYALHAEPMTLYACHCTECQRQTGGSFALSMVVPREALTLTAGTPRSWRRVVEANGHVIHCLFCGDCGSRLYHHPERAPAIAILKPGTLDDTTWMRPIGHIWTRSAQPWVPIPDHMVNYETQPGDFGKLSEAWKAREAM